MNFLGNSNGLVDSIYYYLWMKNDILKNSAFPVKIPDTIIFKSGYPQSWYFTSKQTNELLLHKFEARTTENIYEQFLKNVGQSHIVASYIYPAKYNIEGSNLKQDHSYQTSSSRKKLIKVLNPDDKISIIYFDKEKFMDFLKDPNKPSDGILQKFIEPYGQSETLIQAIWSPTVCILTKKINFRRINDVNYDPIERCATFGSGEVYSRTVPLRGTEISQQIRTLVNNIISRIRGATFEKDLITRGVFYFKPDNNNHLYFCYCSSIRTIAEGIPGLKKGTFHNNTPVSIGDNFAIPKNTKMQSTIDTNHPVKLINDIQCLDCLNKCQVEGFKLKIYQIDLYDVPLQLVVSYNDYILKHRQNQKNMDFLKRGLEKQTSIQTVQKSIRNQLLTRVQKHDSNENEVQFQVELETPVYLGNTDFLVPPVIRKLYPGLRFMVSDLSYLKSSITKNFARMIDFQLKSYIFVKIASCCTLRSNTQSLVSHLRQICAFDQLNGR